VAAGEFRQFERPVKIGRDQAEAALFRYGKLQESLMRQEIRTGFYFEDFTHGAPQGWLSNPVFDKAKSNIECIALE